MTAYYNEIDPQAAQWLRNLIAAGLIAPGVVDERSIEDVRPDELAGFTQCHFFAGIGVWSLALRRAGWPDDRPVWTGSCPCQPFSSAGKRGGAADERHLWPAWHHLIRQCQPGVVFGEQVASKDGLGWLDLVQADLEGEGYASGAVDLCAAGVGAPHIRQRLWFVAERLGHADDQGLERHTRHVDGAGRLGFGPVGSTGPAGQPGGLADTRGAGSLPGSQRSVHSREESAGPRYGEPERQGAVGGLADTDGKQPPHGQPGVCDVDAPGGREQGSAEASGLRGDIRPGPTNGHWRDVDWLFCRDGKWRPVEPGTFPLAHGAAARVVRLRAYGNAIVAQAAQAVIEAYIDTRGHGRPELSGVTAGEEWVS